MFEILAEAASQPAIQPGGFPFDVIERINGMYNSALMLCIGLIALVVMAVLGVAGLQFWRWVVFRRDEKQARKELDEMRSALEGRADNLQTQIADVDDKAKKVEKRIAASEHDLHSICGSLQHNFGITAVMTNNVETGMWHFAHAILQELMGHERASQLRAPVRQMIKTCTDRAKRTKPVRLAPPTMKVMTEAIKAIEQSDVAEALETDVQKLKDVLGIAGQADRGNGKPKESPEPKENEE